MAILSVPVVGCDSGGVKRQNLSGTVTFDGEPVPFGTVSFRPDRERGGSGPAGFARIVDGEYSTKSSGKGAVAGPVEVAIEGYESDQPMAPALFAPYITTTDVNDDSKTLDFDVPQGENPKWFRKGQSAQK